MPFGKVGLYNPTYIQPTVQRTAVFPLFHTTYFFDCQPPAAPCFFAALSISSLDLNSALVSISASISPPPPDSW